MLLLLLYEVFVVVLCFFAGFEPVTSGCKVTCSTGWAVAPRVTTLCILCWPIDVEGDSTGWAEVPRGGPQQHVLHVAFDDVYVLWGVIRRLRPCVYYKWRTDHIGHSDNPFSLHNDKNTPSYNNKNTPSYNNRNTPHTTGGTHLIQQEEHTSYNSKNTPHTTRTNSYNNKYFIQQRATYNCNNNKHLIQQQTFHTKQQTPLATTTT